VWLLQLVHGELPALALVSSHRTQLGSGHKSIKANGVSSKLLQKHQLQGRKKSLLPSLKALPGGT